MRAYREGGNSMKFHKCVPVLILLLVCAACQRSKPAPSEILGTWQTDDPRYNGKFLRFDEDFLVLGLGEDVVPKPEHIEHITVSHEGIATIYLIEARDQDRALDRITVEYSPQNGGELRLSNPHQIVWKKSPDIK